jgi:perosamine synthetase
MTLTRTDALAPPVDGVQHVASPGALLEPRAVPAPRAPVHEPWIDSDRTATVLGSSAIATAIRQQLPCRTGVASLETLDLASADLALAVIDTRDVPGDRCWLASAEILLTSARLAQHVDGHLDVGPEIVLTLVSEWDLDAEAFDPSSGNISSSDVEALRAVARQAPAPWRYEDICRRLVGDCDASLGGEIACEPGHHLSRAVRVAAQLLPDASWICVPEVVAPHADGPWMHWARHPGAGSSPCSRTSTPTSVVAALVDHVAESESAGPATKRLFVDVPMPVARQAALDAVVEESGTPDCRDDIAVVVPPRPIRPSRLVDRQQDSLWSGRVKHGNTWTTELTARLSTLLGVRDDEQLLTVATGTAGLRMSFEQTLRRPAQGDIAVLPAFTFAATAEALLQTGFRLRFADVDPRTWNLDPEALDEALRPGDVSLAVTVDALGAPCDHAKLRTVAERHGVPIVSDSAAALGARHRGAPVAGWQRAHAYSLSFAKTLTAGGAGGVVILPKGRESATNLPRSSMMSEIHAIAALDQLDGLDSIIRRRQQVADTYDEILALHPWVDRQRARIGDQHSWVHYCIRLPDERTRDDVARSLADRGIQTKPYYAPPLHDQSWAHRFDAGYGPAEWNSLRVTTALSRTVLAIPMSSELSRSQLSRVAEGLDSVLTEAEQLR